MVNLALGILSKIISKTTPLCTSALANTHSIEANIDQITYLLVLIRIFVPFLFQNETELEKSQSCIFITRNIFMGSSCSSLQSFLQLSNAADLKLNLMYFSWYRPLQSTWTRLGASKPKRSVAMSTFGAFLSMSSFRCHFGLFSSREPSFGRPIPKVDSVERR